MTDSAKKTHCLIVHSNNDLIRAYLEICATNGFHAQAVYCSNRALDKISKNQPIAIFIDHNLNESFKTKGKTFCQVITDYYPQIKVIMIGPDKAHSAIDSIKQGAADYFTEQTFTAELTEFVKSLKTLCDNQESDYDSSSYSIIGNSSQISNTISLAKRVATTDAPVMIIGPSGSGKELIAQLIHNHSRRSNQPFIKLNCAALNETLLQSELFGHEKGAFTGAATQRIGRFERADKGTLLLDEITETSLEFQAHLLRVLEYQTLERIGSEKTIKIDVRIISTSNKNIAQEIRKGTFREDLYYRLSGIKLLTPPLKDRKCDIENLVWHFIKKFSAESQRLIKDIDKSMMDIFYAYDWPGNVRQLQNTIRTCMAMGTGNTLTIPDVDWIFDGLN